MLYFNILSAFHNSVP